MAISREVRETFALTVALSKTGQWMMNCIMSEGKFPTWSEHLEQLDSNLSMLLPKDEP